MSTARNLSLLCLSIVLLACNAHRQFGDHLYVYYCRKESPTIPIETRVVSVEETSYCEISDEIFCHPNLEALLIMRNRTRFKNEYACQPVFQTLFLNDWSMSFPTQVNNLSQLKYLHIGVSGHSGLTNSIAMPELTTLDVFFTVSPDSLRSEILSSPQLDSLVLDANTYLNFSSSIHLSEKLRYLKFYGDLSASIDQLTHLKNLKELTVATISDPAATAQSLAKFKSLRRLRIYEADLSRRKEISRELESAGIRFYGFMPHE